MVLDRRRRKLKKLGNTMRKIWRVIKEREKTNERVLVRVLEGSSVGGCDWRKIREIKGWILLVKKNK